MSGFNYSKWDNIELSDDEDDLHPNIDKESWFRMKHRSRLEREEREDEEVKQIDKMNNEDATRINIIRARLRVLEKRGAGGNDDEDEDAEFEDIEALKDELKELENNTALRTQRVEEIKERRKWNIDNICTTAEERTIVSKNAGVASLKADDFTPTGETEQAMSAREAEKKTEKEQKEKDAVAVASSASKSPATSAPASTAATKQPAPKPAAAKKNGPEEKSEKVAVLSYNDYVLKHEKVLEDYSEIADMEKTKSFLFKHCDVVLHEHSQSYMLLSCLEDEMNGKHKRMKLVCRQSQILSHIQELAISMARDPRDVVLPFFNRIEEKEYLTAFLDQVKQFEQRIRERAVVKKQEMDEERRREQGYELGPDGLDPFEVLESLPKPMRAAFDSQDIGQLQAVLQSMPVEEAKHWMKQCTGSGLWNPAGANGPDEDEEAAPAPAPAVSAAAAKAAADFDPLD